MKLFWFGNTYLRNISNDYFCLFFAFLTHAVRKLHFFFCNDVFQLPSEGIDLLSSFNLPCKEGEIRSIQPREFILLFSSFK